MTPERRGRTAPDAGGEEPYPKGKIPMVLWCGAMVLTFACIWLQTTPDLFGEELPRNILIWLTVLGAFGQAIAAVVYPELAVRFRHARSRRPIAQRRPGNDLIPPREHFVGYKEERARISQLFARFPRPGWRRWLQPTSWRDDDSTQPALVVVITGAPGTGKSQLANQVARDFLDRFPDGVRRIDLQGDREQFDDTHLELDTTESELPDSSGVTGEAGEPVQDGRSVWDRWFRRGSSGAGSDSSGGLELSSGSAPSVGPWAPRNAYSVLEEALDAIGDPPHGPRRNLEKLWRRLTDGRRLLLVLENAAGPGQIRPLVPNSPLSAVIVTSRRSLVRPTSFADTDFDWETVELFGFSDGEVGLDLLERLAPVTGTPAEVETERERRREIAELCYGLPIALGMCGTRLAAREGNGSEGLLAALKRVDKNPIVHAPQGFRTSFGAAVQQCEPLGRLLLRRMAVTGMHQVADYTAATLLDISCGDARSVLDELHARFLVESLGRADDGRSRYQLPQLAVDTLLTREPEDFELPSDEALAWSLEASHAARERLVRVYTWLAEKAAEAMSHTGDGYGEVPAASRELVDRLGLEPPERPQAWLERDRKFLLGCAWVAGVDGRPDLARRLTRAFAAMCQTVRTHWDEWGEAVLAQRRSAENEGDPHAVAMAMLDESEFSGSRGHCDRGVRLAEAALDAFREQRAHPRWGARALRTLGANLQRRGDLEEARHELESAESIFAAHGELWWQARTRCNLAEVDTHVGTYEQAQCLLEQACDAFDVAGDIDQGDHARILLAEVLARRSLDLRAWSLLQDVRERALDEGKEGYVARCLRALGSLNSDSLERQYLRLAANGDQARDETHQPRGIGAWRKARARRRSWSHRSRVAMLRESIALLDRMGDMWGVHWTRLTLGLTLTRDESFAKGVHELELATAGFTELTDRLWRARSHRIIAERLLAAAMAYLTDSTEHIPAGIGVSTPSFRRRIDAAHSHARRAANAYAEIPDRVGQIRAQLLLARIMRAKSWYLDDVHVQLRAAERLAVEHDLPHFVHEVEQLRRTLDSGGERATVAEYWPIN